MKTIRDIANFLAMPVGLIMIGLYVYWCFFTNYLDGDNNTDWWYLHICVAIPCLGFGPASIIWWFQNRGLVQQDKDSNNPFSK